MTSRPSLDGPCSVTFNFYMRTILRRLQTGDALFVLSFFVLLMAPLLIKSLFGPLARFYWLAYWLPFLALTFALIRGWTHAVFTVLILALAVLALYIQYPTTAPMNFERQVFHEASTVMPITVLLVLLTQVWLSRRSGR
jgi:hypothetical protein